MKPGYLTTEFWISVSAQLLGVLVLIGVLSPTDQASMGDSIAKSVEAIGVIIANTVVIVHYIKSRTEVKVVGIS